jgi:hypothetical protein
MIPSFVWRTSALFGAALLVACGSTTGVPTSTEPKPVLSASGAGEAPQAAAASGVAMPKADMPAAPSAGCLSSGDGYLRAKLGGAVETQLDWPNSGTECHGESRGSPPGVRLSFRRAEANPDLLLVFGLTGVEPGKPGRELAANVTVIVQGTSRIYGTLGDSRCTVDRLEQRPLAAAGTYRIEARGFCTQPAHAVRGSGDVLISTFEFAGPVMYTADGEQT